MLADFLSWIRQMIYLLIFLVLMLQILPSGNYRKYVKFFTGLIFVVALIGPVVSALQNTDLNEMVTNELDRWEVQMDEEPDFRRMEEQRDEYYEKNAQKVMEDISE